MATKRIRRLPGESHDQLWALYVRFGNHRSGPRDYSGATFGRWKIIGIEGWGAGGAQWLAECACGCRKIMRLQNLTKRLSTSCGCAAVEGQITHGMSGSRPYKIWAQMRNRCCSPGSDNYPIYGGRGIEVSEQWRTFEGFWADMGPSYADGLTLERRDVHGHYEPGNCCWIPKADQMQNLQRTVRISTPQGVMTLRQASQTFGINRDTLRARIRYGWPSARLLEGYC